MALNVAQYTAVQRDITVALSMGIDAAQPFYPVLSTVVPSMGSDEKYAWLGALPRVKEWIGDRQFDSMRAADYILPNIHWESSLEVPRTDVDDDRMGTFRPTITQLGTEAAHHPDELLGAAINTGEANACFDGQNFFDTDHLWGDSGVQSNLLTGTKAGATPTVEEFRTEFTNAFIAMMGYKRDNGTPFFRPTVGRMQDLVCAVPLQLWDVATKAFEQTIALESTAGTSNVLLARPQVVCMQYMTDPLKFDLYHVGQQMKPYVFQARQPLRTSVKGPEDIEFKYFKVMTEARYNVGYLAWWTAVRVDFN
jgi:phage major head subunit gpT-like protein